LQPNLFASIKMAIANCRRHYPAWLCANERPSNFLQWRAELRQRLCGFVTACLQEKYATPLVVSSGGEILIIKRSGPAFAVGRMLWSPCR
jgi:hypothetical protein